MKTVLDVIRATFGQDLGPAVLRQVAECDLATLDDFRVKIDEFASLATIPQKGQGELRPFVNLYQPGKPEKGPAPSGIRLRYNSTDLDDPDRFSPTILALKHHLLYCHSIAIDDPLVLLLDWFNPEMAQAIGERSLTHHRQRLVNYLTFLSRVSKLVDGGVLVLVEPNYIYPFYAEGISAPPSDSYDRPGQFLRSYVEDWREFPPADHEPALTQNVARTANFADITEYVRDARVDAPPPEWFEIMQGKVTREFSLVADAEEWIAASLAVRKFHENRLDLYLPYGHFEDTLYGIAAYHLPPGRSEAKNDRREVRQLAEDREMLRTLMRIDLPALDQLGLSDITAIRQGHDDPFKQWRSALRLGLSDLSQCSYPTDEIRKINDHLQAEGPRLRKELAKSSFRNQVRKQGKIFTIATVATAAFTPLIGPAALAAGAGIAGATALGKLLWDYLAGANERKTDAVLNRHYLLFNPDAYN